MELDIKKIEELVSGGNTDEAISVAKEYLSQDLDERTKGEAYVMFASVFMQANNDVMEKYKQILDDANQIASDINKKEDGHKADEIKNSF